MDLEVGQVYGGKYRIARLLGQGSMGAVYEGENVRIRRKVAIKTLHQGVAEKGDTLQRFEREAQAAGRIGSKHICEVLDMGDLPDGSRYMVMEHLDGVTLQQHIKSRGRLLPVEASPIVQQLLEGLGKAHEAGIIHRDLKPANVFLVRQGNRADFVKILDFGVSKFSVLSDEMSMTRTGAVLGTPYYMSPEQAKGSRGTDARSDLYAVGVILYECITGQVPFSAETFNELLFRIVLESPPPAESFVPDLPADFAAIIRKAMAREPPDRYQTAAEFKQVLAAWSAKAEDEASPNFDGLTTVDQKTADRPRPPPPPAPMLRPAPPSTTAQGTVIVQPTGQSAPPANPGLAAQGTVIIDPSVKVPGGSTPPPKGPPPPPPPGPPSNGAARAQTQRGIGPGGPPPPPPPPTQRAGGPPGPPQTQRGIGPTQPLPQWTDPPAGAAAGGTSQMPAQPAGGTSQMPMMQMQVPMQMPVQPGAAPLVPAVAGQPPYMDVGAGAAGFYPAVQPAGAPGFGPPMYGAPGADGVWPAQPLGDLTSEERAVVKPRSSMKAIAVLGIAAGLLTGVAVWAMFWRGGGEDLESPPDPPATTTAAVTAPSTTAPVTTSSEGPAASTATGSSATTPTTATTSDEPVLPTSPATAATPKSTSKAAASSTAKSASSGASTAAAASASGSAKPGGTNPSKKRTVSQDL